VIVVEQPLDRHGGARLRVVAQPLDAQTLSAPADWPALTWEGIASIDTGSAANQPSQQIISRLELQPRADGAYLVNLIMPNGDPGKVRWSRAIAVRRGDVDGCVLGRDFLQYAIFVYSGRAGSFRLELD